MAAKSVSAPIYVYGSQYGLNLENTQMFSVDPSSLSNTVDALKGLRIDPSRVTVIPDSSYLSRLQDLQRGAFIIPDGNIGFLLQDLKGSTEVIKSFVARGVNFLGCSSGGMIACQRLNDESICREDDLLGLLPLEAVSPIVFDDDAMSGGLGMKTRTVSLYTEKDQQMKALWRNGSFLKILKPVPGLKIEACYKDVAENPIAAASGSFGKGKVAILQFDLPVPSKEVSDQKDDAKKSETAGSSKPKEEFSDSSKSFFANIMSSLEIL
jgi:glutamine amidotransferase-like uncharacterized protein